MTKSRLVTVTIMLGALAAPIAARAQDFGLKGGFNAATLKEKQSGQTIEAYVYQTEPLAGIFVATYSADYVFGFQVDVLYSVKAYKAKTGSESLKVVSLEVPVLARVSLIRNALGDAHLLGGVSFARRLDAKLRGSSGSERDVDDEVKPTDAGLTLGLGVDVGRLVVDGRVTWGLTEVFSQEVSGTSIKNRVFAFSAGVRF